MLGAIIGDVVGSIYEFNNIRTKGFPLLTKENKYTDDTVMTLAVLEILQNRIFNKDYVIDTLKKWGRTYPNSGYGGRFSKWLFSDDRESYRSYGNGSAMRISPVGWYANSEREVKELTRLITEVTHSHEEGIKGAEVVAMCIYYAKIGKSKEFIKKYVEKYYSLDFDYEDLRKNYCFNETCQESVPQAIYCFLISKDFEDCLRTTISIGGDCDTTASISCAIAEAYYKEINQELLMEVIKNCLPPNRNGLYPSNLVKKFIDYKMIELVTCEEVKEDTKVIVVEVSDKDRGIVYVDSYYSKHLSVLTDFVVDYGLDNLLHPDEQYTSLDYTNIIELIKFNNPSGSKSLVELERKLKSIEEKSELALTGLINVVNELLKDVNIKMIYFNNPSEAYEYINKTSNVYNEYKKTFDETHYKEVI